MSRDLPRTVPFDESAPLVAEYRVRCMDRIDRGRCALPTQLTHIEWSDDFIPVHARKVVRCTHDQALPDWMPPERRARVDAILAMRDV